MWVEDWKNCGSKCIFQVDCVYVHRQMLFVVLIYVSFLCVHILCIESKFFYGRLFQLFSLIYHSLGTVAALQALTAMIFVPGYRFKQGEGDMGHLTMSNQSFLSCSAWNLLICYWSSYSSWHILFSHSSVFTPKKVSDLLAVFWVMHASLFVCLCICLCGYDHVNSLQKKKKCSIPLSKWSKLLAAAVLSVNIFLCVLWNLRRKENYIIQGKMGFCFPLQQLKLGFVSCIEYGNFLVLG